MSCGMDATLGCTAVNNTGASILGGPPPSSSKCGIRSSLWARRSDRISTLIHDAGHVMTLDMS